MKLIIILLALAIERFLHISEYINRFDWLPKYLMLLKKLLEKSGLWKGIWGVILSLIPILIAVAFIYCIFNHILFGFLGFLFALLVLIYCLGPRDLHLDLEAYFVAQLQDNQEKTLQAAANMGIVTTEQVVIPRKLTQAVFNQYNTRIFAVLFWFIVLGPVGAVLYRLVAEIQRISVDVTKGQGELIVGAALLLDILDWIPIRLAGLGYALMGDFIHGFSYWIKNLFTPLSKNKEFCEQSGLIALNLKYDVTTTGTNSEKDALALIDRTTILFLVVVAVFVLGAYIY